MSAVAHIAGKDEILPLPPQLHSLSFCPQKDHVPQVFNPFL